MITKTMITKTVSLSFVEINDFSQLCESEQLLVNAAIDAAKNAYAPYSNFNVGAAVLLENGVVVTGNNQENAAFPSGLCAERVTLFTAGALHGNTAPRMMAIVAVKDGELTFQPVSPCGACRQVFVEIEKRYSQSFQLLLTGKEKIVKIERAGDLLPLTFNSTEI
ncbi:MAG: cytidine deaminase [Cytophagaceae bacterium]|jgi:cytidine deaminase|nr:cytidine deaminase [Cytophagaceae bacterium]